MKRFGRPEKRYQAPQKGFFSRIAKKPTYKARRHIRHAAEPLVFNNKSRFKTYGAPIKMAVFWKRFKQCLVPALFLTWFGLLVYLPYFKVTKVVFYGLQLIKKDEVNDYVHNTIFKNHAFLPGNNYFFLSSAKIEEELEKKFSVSSVTVTKVFPNEINIELQEKVSTMIYENNKQYFLLDQSGNIIKFLGQETIGGFSTSTDNDPLVHRGAIGIDTSTSSTMLLSDASSTLPVAPAPVKPPNYLKVRSLFGNLPVLLDSSFVSSTTGETNIVPAGSIKGALAFEEIIEKRGVATVQYFELQDPGAGIAIHTTQPWIIYFEPTDDLESQFSNLKMILQSNHPTQYIDLRYGERVYWK